MVFQIPFNRNNSIFQGEVTHLYRLNYAEQALYAPNAEFGAKRVRSACYACKRSVVLFLTNFVKASNAQLSIKCHSSYYLTASVNNCNNTSKSCLTFNLRF